KRCAFWTALDRVAKEVSEHEQLFVVMGTIARIGRRGGRGLESEQCKVHGAYGRDTLSDKSNPLRSFSDHRGLALLNAFFGTVKNASSPSFNRRGKTLFSYILLRQRDRNLVRDVNVHPQPSFLPH
ncbi:unnamed protein product, partial [Ascophyllum nodosum]